MKGLHFGWFQRLHKDMSFMTKSREKLFSLIFPQGTWNPETCDQSTYKPKREEQWRQINGQQILGKSNLKWFLNSCFHNPVYSQSNLEGPPFPRLSILPAKPSFPVRPFQLFSYLDKLNVCECFHWVVRNIHLEERSVQLVVAAP